jgi:hypothetical protein
MQNALTVARNEEIVHGFSAMREGRGKITARRLVKLRSILTLFAVGRACRKRYLNDGDLVMAGLRKWRIATRADSNDAACLA